MSPTVIVNFQPRSNADRCAHCGTPLVDVSAYPRQGRKRACLAGWSSPRKLGALPCGAPRWSDRAA
jgi:recombinational DNA repair protein (RecF pathway)